MKRGNAVWYLISSYCKYSEENCSSQGELTDVIKYAAVPFAELLDLRRPVPGSSHFWNTKQILNSILNNT